MRDYIPKTYPYSTPRTVYMRMLYMVRDTRRLEAEKARLDQIENRTEAQEKHRERVTADLLVVLEALQEVPKFYRSKLLENIMEGTPLSQLEGASEKTFSRWKNRLLYKMAELTGLIE